MSRPGENKADPSLEGFATAYQHLTPRRVCVLSCGHDWLSRAPYPKPKDTVWCRRCDCAKIVVSLGPKERIHRSSRVQSEPTGWVDTVAKHPLD